MRPLPAAALGAAAGVLLLAGCASRPAPFDVPAGSEAHFNETLALCHRLTDGGDAASAADRFDTCMERRGFHRQGALKRAWRGLTGG